MRHYAAYAVILLSTGCSTFQKPMTVASAPPMKPAVIELAAIMTNIKCDMLAFVTRNPALGPEGNTIGGVITYTRTSVIKEGVGFTFGIPIEPAKLGGEFNASDNVSRGQTVITPFYIAYDPSTKDSDLANCADITANRPVKIVEANGVETPARLSSPIIGLGELRKQVEGIVTGQPRIYFTDYTFLGNVSFQRSLSGGANIDVIILKPSINASKDAGYAMSYEIGTDWKAIFAKFKIRTSVDAAAAADIPQVGHALASEKVKKSVKKRTDKAALDKEGTKPATAPIRMPVASCNSGVNCPSNM